MCVRVPKNPIQTQFKPKKVCEGPKKTKKPNFHSSICGGAGVEARAVLLFARENWVSWDQREGRTARCREAHREAHGEAHGEAQNW